MREMGRTIVTHEHMMMNSELGKGAAVMAVGVAAGSGVLRRLLTSPLVMFGAGVAVGYLGFKYRKEIAAAVVRGTEMGKDAVLNARESLADLVEEAKEPGEAK
jgi:hypothetical protein